MNIEEIRTYCISKKAVTEEFPFDSSTLVFKVMGKMFALAPLEKWERNEGSINLKCQPERSIELRAKFQSVNPGYHMNKKHWNTLDIASGELSETLIKNIIDHSYKLVVDGLPLKLRKQLKNE